MPNLIVKPELTTTILWPHFGRHLWPPNNDHPPATATIFGSRGWSLYTGFTVLVKCKLSSSPLSTYIFLRLRTIPYCKPIIKSLITKKILLIIMMKTLFNLTLWQSNNDYLKLGGLCQQFRNALEAIQKTRDTFLACFRLPQAFRQFDLKFSLSKKL